jgi:hypothetical protein
LHVKKALLPSSRRAGDADSYRTLTWGVKWRLNFFKKTRIPVFFAWGTWWNPLLPRCDVALETVIGNPIQ